MFSFRLLIQQRKRTLVFPLIILLGTFFYIEYYNNLISLDDYKQKVIKNPQISETTSKIKSNQSLKENDHFFEYKRPENIFGTESLGENGIGVEMPENLTENIKKLHDQGWKDHNFNQYLSDLISLNRALPDYRSDYCKEMQKNYSKNLPKTSVIIIFHNEAWSTLLRSVHSVLNRSPEHLIEEVILVDDFSDMGELKFELSKFQNSSQKLN